MDWISPLLGDKECEMNKKMGKYGVQSFEIGMQIIAVILNSHGSMKLKEIAAATGMPSSKVHRYMVSMVRTGLVEQDENNSKYDLGPLALNIGLVAVDRLDSIKIALDAISDLCDEINETTALSTWSPNGPIVVRWVRPRKPVAISVTTGTALSMVTTASGRIFGAYLPAETYNHLVEKEIASNTLPNSLCSHSAIDKLYADTRKMGIAIIDDHHLAQGLAAIGAPVFDSQNKIALTLAVVGVEGKLDTRPESPIAESLKRKASSLSKRLGFKKKKGTIDSTKQ